MGLIAEVLAHGGFLPQLADLNKKKSIFNKKNGVMFGIMWFIFFVMLLPASACLANAEDPAAFSAVFGVFTTLMIIVGSLVLLPTSKQYPLIPQQMQPLSPMAHGLHGAQRHALPGQQSIPASAYAAPQAGSWRDTKDLEPSSVTESTTRLLEKEEEKR